MLCLTINYFGSKLTRVFWGPSSVSPWISGFFRCCFLHPLSEIKQSSLKLKHANIMVWHGDRAQKAVQWNRPEFGPQPYHLLTVTVWVNLGFLICHICTIWRIHESVSKTQHSVWQVISAQLIIIVITVFLFQFLQLMVRFGAWATSVYLYSFFSFFLRSNLIKRCGFK